MHVQNPYLIYFYLLLTLFNTTLIFSFCSRDDWWNPTLGKYKGTFLEQYCIPNLDDTKLGSIPINTIFWACFPKKEQCNKTKINKFGVEVVLDLLERI